jgi:hypothetical protein
MIFEQTYLVVEVFEIFFAEELLHEFSNCYHNHKLKEGQLLSYAKKTYHNRKSN